MKLGYIDYLNCFPFYYELLEKNPDPDIEIIPAYPSELNTIIQNGSLHMSPISSGAYPVIRDDVFIIPDFCLSSIGYIRSVVLISRFPIEDLDNRRIGLSSASHTSVVLLKILLEKHYNISPIYLPTSPNPSLEDIDAALIIGNEAMLPEREPIPYSYDLGDLWFRKTARPVVFSIFTVRKDVVSQYREIIRKVLDSFNRSLVFLYTERQKVVESARRRYPDISYDIDTYFSLFKFEFTYELVKSLEYFYQEAVSLGLFPEIRDLQMYDFDK